MDLLKPAILDPADWKSHPAFDPALCINRRQRRVVCTACQDICRQKVFTPGEKTAIQWDRCVDCGLCVTACPTRALAPSLRTQRLLREELDLSAPVSFGCRETEESVSLRMPCLAALPWELLAVIAMRTDLVLYIGACAHCEKPGRREQLDLALRALRDFLGEERYKTSVHPLSAGTFTPTAAPAPTAEEPLSRRGLFAGMRRAAAKNLSRSVAKRLPFLEEEDDGMAYRRLLAGAAAKETENAPAAYGVQLPRFTADCFGCGICTKLCPHGALAFGELRDGQRMVYITPWKCSACGLCEKLCPHGGISGMHLVSVPRLTELALVRVESAACTGCGASISPKDDPPLCPSCAAKERRKSRCGR